MTDTEPLSLRYTSALQSLSHVLLLAPQNPFYVLQAAEMAYTVQDIPLAIRFFLMVIEMAADGDESAKPPPGGITVRAWYGVELVSSTPPYPDALPRSHLSCHSLAFVLVGCAP
jgi:hypothetical protein